MKTNNPMKLVLILKNPEVIRLFTSFMRSEILRLLCKGPMTQTQLSKELGVTKAAVSFHLRQLRDAGLIKIAKYETEQHGISKYYSTVATLFLVDPDHIPEDVRGYFLERQTLHLEGMLSVFKLYNEIAEVTSETLEDLAKAMLRQLKVVGQKYAKEKEGDIDAESLRLKIYAEALGNLIKQKEWCNLFRKKGRIMEIDACIQSPKSDRRSHKEVIKERM